MSNHFLSNKYTNCYYRIVGNAQSNPRSGYTEIHHIIPSCLGGDNSSTNKVRLTAKEHFVVHRLLVKMTSGRSKSKMSFAYNCMFYRHKNHLAREELAFNSRQYARRRNLLAEATSKLHKGKSVSQATIEKIQTTRKANNKPYPESSREVQREKTKERWANHHDEMKAKIFTEETRAKMSAKAQGSKKHSEEGKAAISARTKGVKNPRARTIIVTSPQGEIYHCFGNFQAFCKEHALPFCSMYHLLQKTKEIKTGATAGWSVVYGD